MVLFFIFLVYSFHHKFGPYVDLQHIEDKSKLFKFMSPLFRSLVLYQLVFMHCYSNDSVASVVQVLIASCHYSNHDGRND